MPEQRQNSGHAIEHWSLLAQVSMLAGTVLLLSMISFGLWYEERIARITLAATEMQARTLAATLATGAESAVVTRDAGALETLFVNMRNAPHLRQLAVFDPNGKPRAVVNLDADRRPRLDFSMAPQTPPATSEIRVQVIGGGMNFVFESHSAMALARRTVSDAPIPAAHTVRLELDDALPPVKVDRSKFCQVLGNVLSNAVKYSPAGGEIVVSSHADAGRVGIRVEDHGIGMTPSICRLPRLRNARWRPAMPARTRPSR